MKPQVEMEQVQAEYVRSFSDLGKMQTVHQVKYQLKEDGSLWEIRLEDESEITHKTDGLLLDCSEPMAYNVLRFLYENAVQLDSWRDIVTDLVPCKVMVG